MLSQYDIDMLKMRIKNGETPTLFYVADYNELRENNNYNATFKTDHRYRVIEVRIKDIHNAYYEYMEYINNPNNYHEETETEYYDYLTDHAFINRYIVKNPTGTFKKDLNPRIPSIIYGRKKSRNVYEPVRFIMENEQFNIVVDLKYLEHRNRLFTEIDDVTKTISIRVNDTNWDNLYKLVDITFNDCNQYNLKNEKIRSAYYTKITKDGFNSTDNTYPIGIYYLNYTQKDANGDPIEVLADTYTLKVNKVDVKEYVTESPVREVIYTNAIECGNILGVSLMELLENGDLDWKYMRLENKEIVDGIEYQYLTTEWYYLETINYPTVEYPLINTTDKKCSFFLTLEDAWEYVKECEA